MSTIKNELIRIKNNHLAETVTKLSILENYFNEGEAIIDSSGLYLKNIHGYFRVDVRRIDGRLIASKFRSMEYGRQKSK